MRCFEMFWDVSFVLLLAFDRKLAKHMDSMIGLHDKRVWTPHAVRGRCGPAPYSIISSLCTSKVAIFIIFIIFIFIVFLFFLVFSLFFLFLIIILILHHSHPTDGNALSIVGDNGCGLTLSDMLNCTSVSNFWQSRHKDFIHSQFGPRFLDMRWMRCIESWIQCFLIAWV